MGTAISVELWSENEIAGESAIDAVMAEMHRIDRAMSPQKPGSELSRINRDAALGPVPISAEMARLLARELGRSEAWIVEELARFDAHAAQSLLGPAPEPTTPTA